MLNKTHIKQVAVIDYRDTLGLDQNTKKVYKIRQPYETSLIKTAKKLDTRIR